jgi:hypothetical protein
MITGHIISKLYVTICDQHSLIDVGWFVFKVAHTAPVYISNEESNRGSLDVINV